MEDNFRVRVDKVFGALTATAASHRSLWSLTDEEVEKKEWNRERGREDNPSSSSSNGFFSKQNQSTNDEEEDWEVRSSIGLDSTLDNEEEEDELDKIALGREDAGDRLYMKDITDYGPYLNSHNVLPESFQDHARDSRANLHAAKIRLKEDEKAPGSFESGKNLPVVVDSSPTEDVGNLKSILKRKENQGDTLHKRVRFDTICKESSAEELKGTQESEMKTNTGADGTCTRTVPDYVQNPLKYTRYTFDSASDVDDSSNSKAYMDFSSRKELQGENESESPLTSVTFIPKKKAGADNTRKSGKTNQEDGWGKPTLGILAAEEEACAMEEDYPEICVESKMGSSGKRGRRYRSKVEADDEVVS